MPIQESNPCKITIEYENGKQKVVDKGLIMSLNDDTITTEFCDCTQNDFKYFWLALSKAFIESM